MDQWQLFHGPNAGYVLELYELFRANPQAVDPATRAFFATWTPPMGDGAPLAPKPPAPQPTVASDDKIAGVANLANAIREDGHLAAALDPLGGERPGDPGLDPATHRLDDTILSQLPGYLVGGPIGEHSLNALEAIRALRRVYCHTTGHDYDHLRIPAEREWLKEAAETRRYHPEQSPLDAMALLDRLTQVEGFELFLHRTFVGKKRFSIEGLEMLVPMLDELVQKSVGLDIHTVLIGMAHRGRLNVLAHVLQKPYEALLAEFKDPYRDERGESIYEGWTGDVKYHVGAHLQVDGRALVLVKIAPNPSHLELVNPVVEGMARAAGTRAYQRGEAIFERTAVLPIVIHGDAAFAGQGVVTETLNFSQIPGWRTGGTIHIIANNQVGFTTDPFETRSTLYASDVAKGYKIPIVHVNADDPEACIEAARLAFDYLRRFEKDFVIDLIGYRRHGHNEGDEPRFTQPMMYRIIEQHPTVRQLWAQTLEARQRIPASEAQQHLQTYLNRLQAIYEGINLDEDLPAPTLTPPPAGAARKVETATSISFLRQLNASLHTYPNWLHLHPRLARILKRRQAALDDAEARQVDWAHAEALALASILAEGIPIRFTGEDVERGTFSQRHMALHDTQTGRRFIPLQHIPEARAAFEGRNSPLTENAAVGFEYGYSVQAPERLVLWEAQFGDFVNGAQPVIDEYLASGRAKWEQLPSLVLLLPHGYEGQGPDHSSARLERFLQLCAETNLRVAYPTTAGQYFHLLRRQARLLLEDPLPLVVMTPKSLLRHELAASSLRELAEGRWQAVIDDTTVADRRTAVRRLVMCTGKVYTDLMTSPDRPAEPTTAIVRVEQLYRVPEEELSAILAGYPQLEEVAWLQEEPANMGAWRFLQPYLEKIIAGRYPLHYIGRPQRASPAEGSLAHHTVNQAHLVRQAYTPLAWG